MRNLKPLLLLAGLAAFGLAPHASAEIMTLTYGGVIDDPSGSDPDGAGLFGGGDLQGDAFSAVVTYDTSLGDYSYTPDSSERSGGSAFADPVTGRYPLSPILSVALSANDHTYSFAPAYYATLSTQSGAGGDVNQNATDEALDNASFDFPTGNAPARLYQPFSAVGSGTGYLLTAYQSNGQSDDLSLDLTRVSVAVSAAPEPSAWTLLTVATGLGGLALRRRRSPVALGG